MKQLLILSGKGGTGKTTIASAFIQLSQAKAYADCDVDAPNLHLVASYNTQARKKDYYGLDKAEINTNLCIECDLCRQHCQFEAIATDPVYKVNPYSCEGCGVCQLVCPVEAVTLKPAIAGELALYTDQAKVFSTAKLKMGSGTSGLLVSEVKKQMLANAGSAKLAIIDGSPGIGCPVIASISGVDLVLIVTEPSISGIHDMERIINTAAKFGVEIGVCINKFDTNRKKTDKIIAFCQSQALAFLGTIPYDLLAVKAINDAKSIVDIRCPSGTAVRSIFQATMDLLFTGKS